MNQFLNAKRKNGFTLIELMVAVALFSAIAMVVVVIFVSGFRSQQRAMTFQVLFDQTSFFTEYLARQVRMARRSVGGTCIPIGDNYQTTHGSQGLRFITSECGCEEIFLEAATGRIKEDRDGVQNYLTSEDLKVTDLSFALSGESELDTLQARVTISLKIRGASNRPEGQPALKIQTTISQRKLDIQ
jgi:prepilin-type N-terminal cleavage/methylation domain-containing protein